MPPSTGRPDLRADFLSNEKPIPVTEVGTYRSRALHSNHMKGHVWEEYGSETLRARPVVDGIDEPHDGGRGYYRPISLLSVWAFAPFMHNNAIGPEICGKPTNPAAELYRSPYVLPGTWTRMPNPPPCVPFDPSVEGRYRLFKASIEELLNPEDAAAEDHADRSADHHRRPDVPRRGTKASSCRFPPAFPPRSPATSVTRNWSRISCSRRRTCSD